MTGGVDSQPQIPDVFVSHASSDVAYVDQLVEALKGEDLSYWYDVEHVRPSDSFVRQISDALHARSGVAVISQDYLGRPWTRKELDVLIDLHVVYGLPLIVLAHGVSNEEIDTNERLLVGHPKLKSSDDLRIIARHVAHKLRAPPRLMPGLPVKPRRAKNQRISIARLPALGAGLLGRDDELQQLDRAWESGTNAITVFARGGEGKTALVRHWVQSRIADGSLTSARWVFAWSFAPQGDQAADAVAFILSALRFFGDEKPEKGSPIDRAARLIEYIRNKRGLLILDGLESIQEPPGGLAAAGSVRDESVSYLLKEVAVANPGLCAVTTRVQVHDTIGLERAPSITLGSLNRKTGVALLREIGVEGNDEDLATIVEHVDGHALSITLAGTFIVEAHAGAIPTPLTLRLLDADTTEGRHALQVLRNYEVWLASGQHPERRDQEPGRPVVDLLQLIRMVAVFDRPVEVTRLSDLLKRPEKGLSDNLSILTDRALINGLYKLRDIKLVSLAVEGMPDSDEQREGPASAPVILVDTHPLIREYFYQSTQQERPRSVARMHSRIADELLSELKNMEEINKAALAAAEVDMLFDSVAAHIAINIALDVVKRHRRYDELLYHAQKGGWRSESIAQIEQLRDSSASGDGWAHRAVLRPVPIQGGDFVFLGLAMLSPSEIRRSRLGNVLGTIRFGLLLTAVGFVFWVVIRVLL